MIGKDFVDMDDNNFTDMLKKAQEMINNNQVPEEIKEMASKLGSKEVSSSNNSSNNLGNDNTKEINNSSNSSVGASNNSSGFDFSNIDVATLMKLQGILSKLNSASDDDMSKLLFALKPYLRNEKKEKVDEYIKLARMGKMAELFDLLGRKS